MSQQMGQQPAVEQGEDSPQTQWTFNINLTTTAVFDDQAYKVITGGATVNLNQSGNSPYTGTIQFNYPVMQGQPGATPGQIAWSQRAFPLANVSYQNGILSFQVPTAGPAFQDNFNADDGAPISPPPAGPVISSGYLFLFCGSWDGSSNVITNGSAWVPSGWLEDCAGNIFTGNPPVITGGCTQPGGADPSGGGGGGGSDPPTGTWGTGN